MAKIVKNDSKKTRYIIGIDEVGRGPLAGQVTVGALAVKSNFKIKNFKTPLKDSKKLSTKQREIWFDYFKKHPKVFYATASVSASVIDKIGIQKAIKLAVARALGRCCRTCDVLQKDVARMVEVKLDGLLKAPKRYKQKTIIKGDESVPVISAASIMAKVTRDRKMRVLHKRFPQYGFDNHKGYGTKAHFKAIKKYGLSELHRKSYCRKTTGNRISRERNKK